MVKIASLFLLSATMVLAVGVRALEHAKAEPVKIDSASDLNLVRLHEKVVSGGLPQDDHAFQELQRMGFKTIISVDGATPNVKLAAQYGLRYVHLPHGYDGISSTRRLELAKAVRDLDGPIYIHCHHGKHRSPAAAASACITAGWIDHEQGEKVLALAGTHPKYPGLYQAVRDAAPQSDRVLDDIACNFSNVAMTSPLVSMMVEMEKRFDHLRNRIESSQSNATEDYHEMVLLRELFTELRRIDHGHPLSEEYLAMINESEKIACEAETYFHQAQATTDTTSQGLASQETFDLRTIMKRLSDNCQSCHEKFRDNKS